MDAELTGGAGGPLAAESLANVLAVHLIRRLTAPSQPGRGRDGALPRGRLRAVVEYIEEHLDGCPTLAQIASGSTNSATSTAATIFRNVAILRLVLGLISTNR